LAVGAFVASWAETAIAREKMAAAEKRVVRKNFTFSVEI